MIGSTIGRFHILDRLGAGGMGEVYRARDDQLGRDVAVKVVAPDAAHDATARVRLLREARTAAQLNHPSICTIHEVGESGNQPYIAMELVEGRVLSDQVAGRALDAREAVEIALQIAEAVGHAHERGIVHRDLKCANVMMTTGGRIKVLDFGLARPVAGTTLDSKTDVRITEQGTVPGTLAYMAPEQLGGEPGSPQSDIWSLGIMLYEILTGRRPFTGRTSFELAAAIASSEPPDLPATVPPAVAAIVYRCLDKKPLRRYARASEMHAALEAVRSGSSPDAMPRRSRMSIAVLPLRNLSGDRDQDYFADGVHEALLTDLARIRSLRVIARTTVMRYRDVEPPPETIAAELKVDAILSGSVIRAGQRLRLTVQMIDTASGEYVWSDRFDREIRDVLALQAEIVSSIARQVRLHLTPEEKLRLAERHAVDPEAHEMFLRGTFHAYRFTPDELDAAERYFEAALARDPQFAAAHAGLAHVWANRAVIGVVPHRQGFPRSKAAALEALAIDDTLASAHQALASTLAWHDWDWAAAETSFRRALELNPSHAASHLFYGHFLTAMKRFDEAAQEMDRAMDLDPFNAFFHGLYGWYLVWCERPDDAIASFQTSLKTAPGFPLPLAGLWAAYHVKSRWSEALENARAYITAIGGAALQSMQSGADYRELMGQLALELESQPGSKSFFIAMLFDRAGRRDEAFEHLRKAAEARDHDMTYLAVHPFSAEVRGDERFRALLEQMALPSTA